MESLTRNLSSKKAVIGVIGLGYVGLPRCIQFLKSKFRVYGFDNDIKKLESLKKNKSYLSNLSSKILKKHSKNFICTDDFNLIKKTDIIIICVPTPITKKLLPDLSNVKETLNLIKKNLKKNQAISFEAPTYPGTTEELILPIIKKKFKVGKDFYLIYSPERDDPG